MHKLFTENDYRAFDIAEIFVELNTMSMLACRNAFYKINKSKNSIHETLKYWKYSKRLFSMLGWC